MPNSVANLKAEAWSTMLQDQLRESFVGMNIANTKFEGMFDGNDLVHFPRLAKTTTNDLATSYSNVTVQNLVDSDETFSLSNRKSWAVEISEEDFKEMKISPESQMIRDQVEAYASNWDDVIMNQYASASYLVTDGDMETASNGGTTNSVTVSKSNVYDLITAINLELDAANVPAADRFVVFSPREKRFLAKAPELLRSTDLGDQTVRGGFMGIVDGIKIYWSNNLVTASSVKHVLAGRGKPICFAANLRPKVQITPPQYRDSFTFLYKSMSKYGSKTFTEGAQNLVDVQVTA